MRKASVGMYIPCTYVTIPTILVWVFFGTAIPTYTSPDDHEEMSEEKEQEFWDVTCNYLKTSVGMYHVCDYPYYSCLGIFFCHCHPYFILQF